MSKKRWGQCTFLIALLASLFIGFSVFGEDATKPVFEPSYDNAIKYLDKITSKVWFEGDFLGMKSETNYFFNQLVQAVFWVAKSIFFICGSFYSALDGAKGLMGDYLVHALEFSSSIFTTIFDMPGFGALVIVFWVGIAFLRYATRGANFFSGLLRGLVPILCVLALFRPVGGNYVIKTVYDNTNVAISELATATYQTVSEASSMKTSGGLSNQSKTAVLDKYFDSTIWTTFKYMNSDPGSSHVEETGSLSTDFYLTPAQFNDLVFYDSGDKDHKLDGEEVSKVVGKDKEPKNHMMKAAWGKKFMFALASVVDTLVFGLIIVSLGLASFVLSILMIVMIILGAFVALISLFPSMENILIQWAKRLGVSMFLSGFLTVISVFVLWIFDLITEILMTLLNNNMILVAFLKVIIIYLVYKYHAWIFGVLTAGRLRATNSSLGRQLTKFGSVSGKGRSRTTRGLADMEVAKMSARKRIHSRATNIREAVGTTALGSSILLGRRFRKTFEDAGDRMKGFSDERLQNLSDNPHLTKVKNKSQAIGNRMDEWSAKLADVRSLAYQNRMTKEKADQQKYSGSFRETETYRKNKERVEKLSAYSKTRREGIDARNAQNLLARNHKNISHSSQLRPQMAQSNRERIEQGLANRKRRLAQEQTKQALIDKRQERIRQKENSGSMPSNRELHFKRQSKMIQRMNDRELQKDRAPKNVPQSIKPSKSARVVNVNKVSPTTKIDAVKERPTRVADVNKTTLTRTTNVDAVKVKPTSVSTKSVRLKGGYKSVEVKTLGRRLKNTSRNKVVLTNNVILKRKGGRK